MKLCSFFWNILAYICYHSFINCALYINKGLLCSSYCKESAYNARGLCCRGFARCAARHLDEPEREKVRERLWVPAEQIADRL